MATGSGMEDGTGIASVQGLCCECIVVDSCGLAKIVNFPHPHGVGRPARTRRRGKCLANASSGLRAPAKVVRSFWTLSAEA
jgi:hypothetical protein